MHGKIYTFFKQTKNEYKFHRNKHELIRGIFYQIPCNLSEDICHQLINQFNLGKKTDIVYRCEHIVIVTTIATCYEIWKV